VALHLCDNSPAVLTYGTNRGADCGIGTDLLANRKPTRQAHTLNQSEQIPAYDPLFSHERRIVHSPSPHQRNDRLRQDLAGRCDMSPMASSINRWVCESVVGLVLVALSRIVGGQ